MDFSALVGATRAHIRASSLYFSLLFAQSSEFQQSIFAWAKTRHPQSLANVEAPAISAGNFGSGAQNFPDIGPLHATRRTRDC
jgi:hypothetical protein